jgi:hypothetical protein
MTLRKPPGRDVRRIAAVRAADHGMRGGQQVTDVDDPDVVVDGVAEHRVAGVWLVHDQGGDLLVRRDRAAVTVPVPSAGDRQPQSHHQQGRREQQHPRADPADQYPPAAITVVPARAAPIQRIRSR